MIVFLLTGLGIFINNQTVKAQNPQGLAPCADCKGTGTITKSDKCWLCKGEGKVRKTVKEKCTNRDCNNGIVISGNFSDKCPTCDGGKKLRDISTMEACTVSDCNNGYIRVKSDCKCKQYKK